MPITSRDEGLHEAGTDANWQENYLFVGLEPAREAGFYLHLGRLPALDLYVVKAATFVGGDVVSVSLATPLGGSLDTQELTIDTQESLKRWRLSYRGEGGAGHRAGLLCTDGRAEVPLQFDIWAEAPNPPLEMRGGMSRVDYGEAHGLGYEQAFRWGGVLVVGEHTVEAHGLGVGDHSWGVRRIDGWERCWWTTMAGEDASVLLTGMNLLKDGRERSLGLRQDATGVSAYPSLAVDVRDPDALWPAATVTFGSAGGDDLRVATQLVTRLPMVHAEGSGQAFLSDDTLCTVTASDGTTGFAMVEHNRPLRHHELAELRAHTYSQGIDDAYRDEARTL